MSDGTIMNLASQCLYFPWMHADLAPAGVRSRVVFLDPGLGEQGAMVRPEGLPLDDRAARKYISDALQFGSQFKKSGDMAALGAVGMNDFFSNTALKIQDEILGQTQIEAPDKAMEMNVLRTKAQMTLLLAWTLEERLLEIKPLQASVNQSWDRLGSSLGLDDEDDEVAKLGLSSELLEGQDSNPLRTMSTYKSLLQAFMTLLPASSVVLVTTELVILDRWEELKIQTTPWGSATSLSEGWPPFPGSVLVKASGADLLGLKTLPAPGHWLADERTMLYIPTGGPLETSVLSADRV